MPTDAPVPRVNKVWDSVDEAVQDVKSGDTVLSGGPSRYDCLPEHLTNSSWKGLDFAVLLVSGL